MTDNANDKKTPAKHSTVSDESSTISTRRNVMKKAVVVGGMTVSVQQWTKPVVDSVVLPAHALFSAGNPLTVGVLIELA